MTKSPPLRMAWRKRTPHKAAWQLPSHSNKWGYEKIAIFMSFPFTTCQSGRLSGRVSQIISHPAAASTACVTGGAIEHATKNAQPTNFRRESRRPVHAVLARALLMPRFSYGIVTFGGTITTRADDGRLFTCVWRRTWAGLATM